MALSLYLASWTWHAVEAQDAEAHQAQLPALRVNRHQNPPGLCWPEHAGLLGQWPGNKATVHVHGSKSNLDTCGCVCSDTGWHRGDPYQPEDGETGALGSGCASSRLGPERCALQALRQGVVRDRELYAAKLKERAEQAGKGS